MRDLELFLLGLIDEAARRAAINPILSSVKNYPDLGFGHPFNPRTQIRKYIYSL